MQRACAVALATRPVHFGNRPVAGADTCLPTRLCCKACVDVKCGHARCKLYASTLAHQVVGCMLHEGLWLLIVRQVVHTRWIPQAGMAAHCSQRLHVEKVGA